MKNRCDSTSQASYQKGDNKRRRLYAPMYKACGNLLDLLACLVSATPLPLAVAVAVQQMNVWGALVAGTLAVSSAFLALAAAHRCASSSRITNSLLLWFLFLLPFGLLFPPVEIVMRLFNEGWDIAVPTGDAYETGTAYRAIKSVREEVDRIEQCRKGVLLSRWRAPTAFYVQAVVVDLPQSILQLMALCFVERPTTLQVVSVAVLAVALASRTHLLCDSFTVSMFFLKFALLSFDVFSLFYVFSTLLARDAPHEIALPFFPDAPHVTYLSYVWIVKTAVVFLLATLAIFVAGAFTIFSGVRTCRCCVDGSCWLALAQCVGGLVGFCVLCGPAVFVFELCKFAWLIAYLFFSVEPRYNSSLYPTAAAAFLFCSHCDYDERMRALAKGKLQQELRQKLEPSWAQPLRDKILHEPFSARSLCRGVTASHHHRGLYAVGAVLAVSQGFSAAFPFVDAMLHWDFMSPLQRFCFYALCCTLCGAVLLLPRGWTYWWFCVEARAIKLLSTLNARTLHVWMADYFCPPLSATLRLCVSRAVLPEDVVLVVSKFMSQEDVAVDSLSVSECTTLKVATEGLGYGEIEEPDSCRYKQLEGDARRVSVPPNYRI